MTAAGYGTVRQAKIGCDLLCVVREVKAGITADTNCCIQWPSHLGQGVRVEGLRLYSGLSVGRAPTTRLPTTGCGRSAAGTYDRR